MKKIFIKIISIFTIFLALISSFLFYKNQGFEFYKTNKSEKNTVNYNFLDKKIVKIISIGHELSYADLKWIGFIQYIGNNPLLKENSIRYSQNLLENLSEISPFFSKLYEWAIFVMPIPTNSNPEYTQDQKKFLEKSLNIGYKGMENLCNSEKIEKILSKKLGNELWEDENLKNPCKDGMIPYLIAFYGGQLGGDSEIAKKYYTISSMNSDVPTVSKILATINSSGKNNYKNLALNFSLIAIGSHDEEPYNCLELANKNIEFLQKNLTKNEIIFLEEKEKSLKEVENSIGKQNCYDMLERGIKYSYLDFINKESQNYKEIKNIEELLKKIGLENVPTVKTQENMTMCYKNENWEYCSK